MACRIGVAGDEGSRVTVSLIPTSSTGGRGRFNTRARSPSTTAGLDNPAPVKRQQIRYNPGVKTKRPGTADTARGMAHEEKAS